jgi:hypothetical protein
VVAQFIRFYRCSTGKAANPVSRPSHDGCVNEAPKRPHLEQRAQRRRRSLLAEPPHLIMSGARAFGALCRHFKQFTHNLVRHRLPRPITFVSGS